MRLITFVILLTCSISLVFAQRTYRGGRSVKAVQFYKRAELQAKLGNDQLAKRLYINAIGEDDHFIEALDNLGDLYRENGNLDSAVFFYKLSLEAKPRGILARQNLAATYQLLGNDEYAIEEYHQLLNYYPNYPEAYYGLAKVYLARKSYFRGITYAETALRKFMDSDDDERIADTRMLLARAYMMDNQYETAKKILKANKKDFGHKPFYHYYLGVCYLKLDKDKKAEKYLNKAKRMGYYLPTYVEENL